MLVEAAGRLALAQARLDLVLRLSLATLCGAPNSDAFARADETEMRDLCCELSLQFRARCRDANMRTKLRAILLACERLSDEGGRLLRAAWTVSQDCATQADGPLLADDPSITHGLGRLAAEITALARVIDKARRCGFIAKAAAEEIASIASTTIVNTHANRPAIVRATEVLSVESSSDARALASNSQPHILQLQDSRLVITICPNCQTKVVSTRGGQ